MTPSLLHDLAGPLHMHFMAARAAYRHYLDDGRTFLLAISLRRLNRAARRLLVTRGHLLPPELHEDAAALVAHYDVWLTLWSDLRDRLQPALADRFVFATVIAYPRESEERIENLFRRLQADDGLLANATHPQKE